MYSPEVYTHVSESDALGCRCRSRLRLGSTRHVPVSHTSTPRLHPTFTRRYLRYTTAREWRLDKKSPFSREYIAVRFILEHAVILRPTLAAHDTSVKPQPQLHHNHDYPYPHTHSYHNGLPPSHPRPLLPFILAPANAPLHQPRRQPPHSQRRLPLHPALRFPIPPPQLRHHPLQRHPREPCFPCRIRTYVHSAEHRFLGVELPPR